MDQMSHDELDARIKAFMTKKHQQFPRLGLIRKEKPRKHREEYFYARFLFSSAR